MTDTPSSEQLIAALAESRTARRRFLAGASRTGLALGTVALLDACGGSSGTATPTPGSTATVSPSPTATSVIIDQDALNFLINIEYLTAQFYAAVTATPLAASLLTGTGAQGTVTGGRAMTFTDALVGQYARELAADNLAHVGFLRSILGVQVVAQPAINIDGGASGAFTTAMLNAGVITSGTFDPYASDENFLLSAYFLTDVAVTAYKGAGLLFTDQVRLNAVAGIMGTEAYHAGLLRTTLYAKGATNPTLRTNAGQISDYRDSLDGTTTDDDQGITGTGTASNITPADANGFAFTRTAGQALNIFYLNRNAVVGGGFFPSGVNGNTRTSAAS